MTISLKTQKMLWGRSAGRCAFPDCRLELVFSEQETDDPSLVGDIAHIIADSSSGPRGERRGISEEQVNKYNNLVLLCKNHHKLIDDQPNTYTVEALKTLKQEHEEWVEASLGIDLVKQQHDEIYANYLEEWEHLAELDNWQNFSFRFLNADRPYLTESSLTRLCDLNCWLFNRIWPNRYKELEDAFENFSSVLDDLLRVFQKHSITFDDNLIVIDRFYKIDRWDPPLYRKLLNEYRFHVGLVQDLFLELTRAANLICQKTRRTLFSSYRIQQGVLLVESGPYSPDLTNRIHKVQYAKEDLQKAKPYPGLERFLEMRENRDVSFANTV